MNLKFDGLMNGEDFLSALWLALPAGMFSAVIWVLYAGLLNIRIRAARTAGAPEGH